MTLYRVGVLAWSGRAVPPAPQHTNETWAVSAANPDEALTAARRAARADGFRVCYVNSVVAVSTTHVAEEPNGGDTDAM